MTITIEIRAEPVGQLIAVAAPNQWLESRLPLQSPAPGRKQ
jgi:hypothetical protein